MIDVNAGPEVSKAGPGALEKQLEEKLRQDCKTSQRIGYRPDGFLRALNRLGAVGACKRVIMRRQPADEFITLWHLNRLDLSPENTVLRGPWRILFETDVLEKARSNLRDYERPDLADFWRSTPGS